MEAAQEYMDAAPTNQPINEGLPFAYIDGSFSKKESTYSWGGYISFNERIFILQGSGNASDYLRYRNMTGEVRGALAVMQKAIELGISEINLFHDALGIGRWATGQWECKNKLTRFYRDYYMKHSDRLKVNFIHVDGHTGIEGNEIADYLAREAAGGDLKKKEIAALQEFRKRAEQEPQEAPQEYQN